MKGGDWRRGHERAELGKKNSKRRQIGYERADLQILSPRFRVFLQKRRQLPSGEGFDAGGFYEDGGGHFKIPSQNAF